MNRIAIMLAIFFLGCSEKSKPQSEKEMYQSRLKYYDSLQTIASDSFWKHNKLFDSAIKVGARPIAVRANQAMKLNLVESTRLTDSVNTYKQLLDSIKRSETSSP